MPKDAPTWVSGYVACQAIASAVPCELSWDAFDILRDALRSGKVRGRIDGVELSPDAWPNNLGDLMKEGPSLRDAEIRRLELNRFVAKLDAVGGAKRGPKQSYDWDACWAWMVSRFVESGLPETQGEMVSAVREWFEQNAGRHPGDTEIKKRVSLLFHAVRGNLS